MITIVLQVLLHSFLAGGENRSARISLTATDKSGNQHTIVCGSHPAASLGYDTQLGELPVPPVPSNDIFDLRFLDPPGIKREPSTGTYVDIRPQFGSDHPDTFVVRIRTQAEAYPVRLTWSFFANHEIVIAMLVWPAADSTVSVDMLKHSEVSIRDNHAEELKVILLAR